MNTTAELWRALAQRRKRQARTACVACFALVFVVLPFFYYWSVCHE